MLLFTLVFTLLFLLLRCFLPLPPLLFLLFTILLLLLLLLLLLFLLLLRCLPLLLLLLLFLLFTVLLLLLLFLLLLFLLPLHLLPLLLSLALPAVNSDTSLLHDHKAQVGQLHTIRRRTPRVVLIKLLQKREPHSAAGPWLVHRSLLGVDTRKQPKGLCLLPLWEGLALSLVDGCPLFLAVGVCAESFHFPVVVGWLGEWVGCLS
jgi:hypothetical protein